MDPKSVKLDKLNARAKKRQFTTDSESDDSDKGNAQVINSGAKESYFHMCECARMSEAYSKLI